MERPRWDVIVAGAGPAGCHAAWELGRRGWHVLLIDRASFPRWKPCAGGITVKASPYIPAELRNLFEREMSEAVISYGPRLVTRIRSSRPVGWVVHRETFDAAHLELVRSLDRVDVLEGCTVRDVIETAWQVVVTTSCGELRSLALVGADGVESRVRRAIFPTAEREFAATYEMEARMPHIEDGPASVSFDLQSFPGGYGWIFPKRTTFSIGGYVEGGPGGGRVARARLERFIACWPQLEGSEPVRARGYRIPVGGSRARMNTNRIVLAGDAAGTVDPVTGEGISYAFMTGHLAAQAIDAMLKTGRSLDGYGLQLWWKIHGPFVLARRLSDLLFHHPRSAFEYLFRNRRICGWFVRVIRGEMTYAGLLARAAVLAPVLIPSHRNGHEVTFNVP
ncbi:MAG: geranylgeranyl reductase family protein [Acidobacteria bacterium]|nr:geranylgeranyl reductase family protein [Acidobacteriota bacterium]